MNLNVECTGEELEKLELELELLELLELLAGGYFKNRGLSRFRELLQTFFLVSTCKSFVSLFSLFPILLATDALKPAVKA